MCAMVCVTGASRWGYTECRSAAGFEVSEPDGTHLYYTMGESEFGRYFITKHREGVNAPGAKRKAGQPASAASLRAVGSWRSGHVSRSIAAHLGRAGLVWRPDELNCHHCR